MLAKSASNVDKRVERELGHAPAKKIVHARLGEPTTLRRLGLGPFMGAHQRLDVLTS